MDAQMNRKFSIEYHMFALKKWWQLDQDYVAVKEAFIQPCRQTIFQKLNKRFKEKGSVADLP